MRIEGKRIKKERWIHTRDFVVVVEVEAVFPSDDESEPCYEAETVEFLREVEEHAQRRDVEWLQRHGRVYRALDAA